MNSEYHSVVLLFAVKEIIATFTFTMAYVSPKALIEPGIANTYSNHINSGVHISKVCIV